MSRISLDCIFDLHFPCQSPINMFVVTGHPTDDTALLSGESIKLV